MYYICNFTNIYFNNILHSVQKKDSSSKVNNFNVDLGFCKYFIDMYITK